MITKPFGSENSEPHWPESSTLSNSPSSLSTSSSSSSSSSCPSSTSSFIQCSTRIPSEQRQSDGAPQIHFASRGLIPDAFDPRPILFSTHPKINRTPTSTDDTDPHENLALRSRIPNPDWSYSDWDQIHLLPICHGCDSPISDRHYSALSDGKQWHSSCLRCDCCSRQLEFDPSCFVRHGKVYCRSDYDRLFGCSNTKRLCALCNQPLNPSDLIFRTSNKLFHQNCFSCELCHRLLRTGDLYGICQDRTMCAEHYKHALRLASNGSGFDLKQEPDQWKCDQVSDSGDHTKYRSGSKPEDLDVTELCHRLSPPIHPIRQMRVQPVIKNLEERIEGSQDNHPASSVDPPNVHSYNDPRSQDVIQPCSVSPVPNHPCNSSDSLAPTNIDPASTLPHSNPFMQLSCTVRPNEPPVLRSTSNPLHFNNSTSPSSMIPNGLLPPGPLFNPLMGTKSHDLPMLGFPSLFSAHNSALINLIEPQTSGFNPALANPLLNYSVSVPKRNRKRRGGLHPNFDSACLNGSGGFCLNMVTRQKRMRTSFKHHQLRTMKAYFNMNHNPDVKDLKILTEKTGLSKRVLQVWFQNARAKYRRSLLRQEPLNSPNKSCSTTPNPHLNSSSTTSTYTKFSTSQTMPNSISDSDTKSSQLNHDLDALSQCSSSYSVGEQPTNSNMNEIGDLDEDVEDDDETFDDSNSQPDYATSSIHHEPCQPQQQQQQITQYDRSDLASLDNPSLMFGDSDIKHANLSSDHYLRPMELGHNRHGLTSNYPLLSTDCRSMNCLPLTRIH